MCFGLKICAKSKEKIDFYGTVIVIVSVVKTQYPQKGWSVSATK